MSKHWTVKAKTIYFYKTVHENSDESDYELDLQFSWRGNLKRRPRGRPHVVTEPSLESAYMLPQERPRTFERIATLQTLPRATTFKRGMDEMLDLMNADERFQGIKDIFYSNIWVLLRDEFVLAEKNIAAVTELMNKYGLVESRIADVYKPRQRSSHGPLAQTVYRNLLNDAVKLMTVTDSICFLWHIHLRQIFLQDRDYIVLRRLEPMLDSFFNNNFGHYSDIFRVSAARALSVSRLHFTEPSQEHECRDNWQNYHPIIEPSRIGTLYRSNWSRTFEMLLIGA
jgi:hypothetical protein